MYCVSYIAPRDVYFKLIYFVKLCYFGTPSFGLSVLLSVCIFFLFFCQFFVDEKDHTDVWQDMKEVGGHAFVQAPGTFIPHGLAHTVEGPRVLRVAILKPSSNNLKQTTSVSISVK